MSCQTAGFSKWTRFPNCYFILSKFHDSFMELKLKLFLLKTSLNFSKNRTKKAYILELLSGKMASMFGFNDLRFIYRLPRGTFSCLSYSLPKKGFFCFRAQEIAWIFPSVPRTPNPPGTSTPLCKRAYHKHPFPVQLAITLQGVTSKTLVA